MINFRKCKFIKSATSKDDSLFDYDHIVLVGRSNVGKSTLINSLVDNKGMAFVSKRPGQTKLLNYFLIDDSFYLVDAEISFRLISMDFSISLVSIAFVPKACISPDEGD